MCDNKFTTTLCIVNLHPKEEHWVKYTNETHLITSIKIIKLGNKGGYSEYQIQKNDSNCPAYCIYIFIAALKMQYQMFTFNDIHEIGIRYIPD